MKPNHLSAVLVLIVVAIGMAIARRSVEQPAPMNNRAATGGSPIQITPPDAPSVQHGIDAAYKAGYKKIVIPAGTYHLSPAEGPHLQFSDMADFEIDATGVTLVLDRLNRMGIAFQHCRNVTLRGVTLVHGTPPFTQGRIVDVAPDRKSCEIRIAAGYPALDAPFHPTNPVAYLFDPERRQWKTGGNDYYSQGFEKLGPGAYRLRFERPVDRAMEVGDLVAFRGPGGQDIYLRGCAGMRIVGVTIRSGSGFCVHEDGGNGGNYYNYTVTYGPRPVGATENPLIASNADAFHSGGMRHGPTLEGCRFEGMCDDGVPIHGYYSLVVAAEARSLTVTDDRFLAKDPIRLFDDKGGYAGEAIVTSVRALPGFHTDARSTHRGFPDLAGRHFTELTLDKPLPARFDFLVSNPNANGSGYVVRNCIIRNHRARGMLLKADNGLVEGCTVEGSTIDGIIISPELWWNEACYSRNVVIRKNIIRNVGYAMVGPWTGQAGAISLVGEGPVGIAPGHQHIVIEDNRFEDCNGTNLLVDHARDVLIRRNRFIRAQENPSTRGADHLDPASLISISNSNDVRLERNTVVGPRHYGKELVSIAPTATHVVGAATDVTTTTWGR